MPLIQSSVQDGLLHPIRKTGLAIARRWPWPVRARVRDDAEMFVDLRSAIGRGIFMKGEFDPEIFPPLRQALANGGTFLDVGANVGYYSVLASRALGASGRVHAFEIDPRPLRCLRKTVKLAGRGNIHVHEVAIGNRTGAAFLHADRESGNSTVDVSGRGQSVPMTTLDEWMSQTGVTDVKALKVDIEGGELAALQGAERLLRNSRPVIVCEVLFVEARSGHGIEVLYEYLKSIGYRITSMEMVHTPTILAIAR